MKSAAPAFAAALTLLVSSLPAADSNSQVEGSVLGSKLLPRTDRSAKTSKLQFSGNVSFKDEQLRATISEQIREIDEQGVSAALADDAAYFIGAYYRKSGFAQVETSYQIIGNRVIVRINEGPRTLLRELHFLGNHAFSEKVLFDYMIGATPKRLKREPDLFPFDQGEINAGADRVRGYYVSEGYLDAVVDASDVNISRGGRDASVVVKIDERTRYTFGELKFEGETPFTRSELLAATKEKTDGAFSRTKAIAMQRNLESFYRSKGYFLVDIQLAADPKNAQAGKVPVTFIISSGALHNFDGVTAHNETARPRLRPSFIPRRFQHLTGKIYNPEKIDETYRELLRSGLFTNLRLNPVALPDKTVRLDFTFEEAKAREVGFTLGYGIYDGLKTGIRLADRNLFGNGRPLTLNADYSQRGLVAELGYVDPWFLDHPHLTLRSKIFSAERQEEGYSKNEVGARAELAWRALPHLELSAFVQPSHVDILNSTIDPLLLGPTSYSFLSVGLTQTTDYRDNLITPTRGWIFSTAVDVGTIDGERAFTRSVGRYSWYHPIGKCQFAFGARGGYIQPAVESIPIDLRFFNGGATTVRSFAERQLGPKDKSGNPLGGEFYTVLNAELTFPIWGALQGATFVDAGNLRGHTEAGVNDMRYAIGGGLRYALPFGPIRLDYGYNPNRHPNEDSGAFHFSFGIAF